MSCQGQEGRHPQRQEGGNRSVVARTHFSVTRQRPTNRRRHVLCRTPNAGLGDTRLCVLTIRKPQMQSSTDVKGGDQVRSSLPTNSAVEARSSERRRRSPVDREEFKTKRYI